MCRAKVCSHLPDVTLAHHNNYQQHWCWYLCWYQYYTSNHKHSKRLYWCQNTASLFVCKTPNLFSHCLELITTIILIIQSVRKVVIASEVYGNKQLIDWRIQKQIANITEQSLIVSAELCACLILISFPCTKASSLFRQVFRSVVFKLDFPEIESGPIMTVFFIYI